MVQDQTVYSVVIMDNQDYWDWRTDYLGTATSVEQAKEMLRGWIIDHNYIKQGIILDHNLEHSIVIIKHHIGKIANYSENNYITIDINNLVNGN